MKLLVDHREGPRFLEMVERLGPVEVVQLPLGDLLIVSDHGGVVVERKTPRDFVESVWNHHLWEQLLRMAQAGEILGHPVRRRLLVIDGPLGDYLAGRRSGEAEARFYASMMGALLEILFVYQTPVVLAENPAALEALLRVEVKREVEGENDGPPEGRWHLDFRKRNWEVPTRDDKRIVLSAIPLIGEEHAQSLLDHFGSLANVAAATVKDLTRVKGIGEKRAQRIYDIFH
ncbi:MAG: ERCC4-type nuclease [Euryarchaeota archaeon]|nr:ERCC4-type nuclease [Euryarchaeota archaeon]